MPRKWMRLSLFGVGGGGGGEYVFDKRATAFLKAAVEVFEAVFKRFYVGADVEKLADRAEEILRGLMSCEQARYLVAFVT
jgi:hypothetical protein